MKRLNDDDNQYSAGFVQYLQKTQAQQQEINLHKILSQHFLEAEKHSTQSNIQTCKELLSKIPPDFESLLDEFNQRFEVSFVSSIVRCEPCEKSFQTKKQYDQHITTSAHNQKEFAFLFFSRVDQCSSFTELDKYFLSVLGIMIMMRRRMMMMMLLLSLLSGGLGKRERGRRRSGCGSRIFAERRSRRWPSSCNCNGVHRLEGTFLRGRGQGRGRGRGRRGRAYCT